MSDSQMSIPKYKLLMGMDFLLLLYNLVCIEKQWRRWRR